MSPVMVGVQSIYASYDDSISIKLADWSAISGFCFWVLAAAIPSFHYLRPFSAISILLILMFVFITIGTAAKDGEASCNRLLSLDISCPQPGAGKMSNLSPQLGLMHLWRAFPAMQR